MPSINAIHSYLIKPIRIPRYLTTVYCLRGAAPIGLSVLKKILGEFVLLPLVFFKNFELRVSFFDKKLSTSEGIDIF
jgi:hypothetical protein